MMTMAGPSRTGEAQRSKRSGETGSAGAQPLSECVTPGSAKEQSVG
jgi:hypothetical protein